VAPGRYVVAVDAAGFQRWTRTVDTTASVAPLDVVLPIPGISESVAVTAPKLEEELPQELEKLGVRVQTITSAQIENGGYYDVAQALQALVPGLFLTPKAGPFDYVDASLQGSRTNEILWLVDGVRISNRLYNGTTPLDTIPAHMIERVEVIEGGQGLFYGTQAVAGAINVVTKSFADTANGRLQGGFDTNKGGHVNLFARQAFGGHKVVVFGSKDEAEGYQSFPASQYQPSATDRRRGYDVVTFGGKYAYDFSKAVRLSAMFQRSDVTLDNLRPGRSGAAHVGGLAAGFNERAEHIFSAKVDYTPRRNTELFFKTYYHQWDSHFNETRNVSAVPGTSRVSSDNEFWGFKDYGANVLAKLTPTPGFEYFAGYDFQNYRGRDEVLLISPNTETVHALFGQVRTTRALFEKASLALGARVNAPSNSQSATVWSLSGQYDFTPTLFARSTVGTAFRYPDAYELFASDPTCCFGNPNLEPERSTNVNASIGHRLSAGSTAVTVEAIGFYRRVSNLIVDVDDGSGDTTITANRPGVVRVRGVSLVGSAVFTPSLASSLSYTYNRSQRTNELAGGYSALNGIPSNQVDATLDFHPARAPFGVTLTVNGIGRVTNTVPFFGAVPGGDYTVVDLSGRFFLDSRRRHRINVRLENLFDQEYSTRNARNFLDQSATPFLVNYLGVPRTFHLSYSVGF
jgi:vitamin B12 transporter